MTGINTVISDDPSLTLRLESLSMSGEIGPGQIESISNPLRIILDSHLKLPLTSRLLRLPGDILIVTSYDDASKREAISSDNIEVITLPHNTDGQPRLNDLMNVLAAAQVNEILVESGHILAGSLLRAQLVDEIILYIAPTLLGSAAKGLFKLPALSSIKAKLKLEFTDVRAIGPDLRIIAKPNYTGEG
jgi:diaminohydroxyphosphoribosylaminopyrimidine deaminase/5-amino-6-(5-phosphoribosylamino)uracil reductase